MNVTRDLLEGVGERFSFPEDAFERMLRRHDRKRRNQRIAAGIVGIALFLAIAVTWIVESDVPSHRIHTPAGTSSASTPSPSTERVGFIGLPPEGATPSTPKRGELVLSFYGGTTKGPAARTRVRVYADGRMIWQRDASLPYGANRDSTGFLQQGLTPEGVELLRSEAISTGLFNRDRDLFTWLDIACYNSIRVPNGGRLVQVTYRRASCVVERPAPATPEENQLLLRLDARLSDPSSWLPASAWEDATIRPYVPARFAVCATAPTEAEVFSVLPPAATDLLRANARDPAAEWGPRDHCFDLTTDKARVVARSLEAAGIRPDDGDANVQTYRVEDVLLRFVPYMPDGEIDCGCGG